MSHNLLERTGTHPTDQLNGQDPEDVDHLICECSPDVAFCGGDMTGVPFLESSDGELCDACLDMATLACLRCNT